MSGKSYGMKYSLLPLLFDSIQEWGCLIVEGSMIMTFQAPSKLVFFGWVAAHEAILLVTIRIKG